MRALRWTLALISVVACGEDVFRSGAELEAYSVQLHVHGSFSEGMGSIDSHSYQARELGLDAIWWSDHDDVLGGYRRSSSFGFEDWEEPLDRNEAWTALFAGERARKKGLAEGSVGDTRGRRAEFTAERAAEGERSFRVSARSHSKAFQEHLYRFVPSFGQARRPLAADVTIHLEIWPEHQGVDGRAIVLVALSEHAPVELRNEKIGLEQYWIQYYLDENPGEPIQLGSTLYVPLRYEPDRWNRYALSVTADAVEGFPFIRGLDNTLYGVSFGVKVRNGVRASALFDALRIEHALDGQAVYQAQRTLLDEIAASDPGLAQLQGLEISGGRHLNEFSLQAELLDYDALLRASGLRQGDPPSVPTLAWRSYVAHAAVDAVHARGGLVSYNHMFGTQWEGSTPHATREAVLADLLETRVFGADILEVGYRDRGGHVLDDHLWIWDELAKRGLFPVGTGVSDAHGGHDRRWRKRQNNFVSWIYARSTAKADLLEGLRAGRVFFGDLILFDGKLSLDTERGFSMGQIVVTDRNEVELSIALRGLAPGDQVRLVDTGDVAARHYATGSDVAFSHRMELAETETGPRVARVEVYGPVGRAKVFSNPIVFLREAPSDGLPAARVGVDVAGCVSRSVRGFEVTGVRARDEDGTDRVVEIGGRASSGQLTLDCVGLGASPSVELGGLEGSWEVSGDRLRLDDLNGTGRIRIRSERPRR